MSNITLTSTTDNNDEINAALGKKTEEKAAAQAVEKESEQESASPAEQDTDKTEELEESDATSKDEDESEEDESKSEEKPKKKSGIERRFKKLAREMNQLEQEREYWRKEALKNQSTQPDSKQTESKPVDSSERPRSDKFENYDDYLEALADWKADQKLKERDTKTKEAEIKTAFQKQVEEHTKRVEKFAETVEDFDDAMEAVSDVPMSVTVHDTILDSDSGPELMYALAKDKENYKRICALPPLAAARELGKIEAKILASKESSEKQPKTTTKAPTPIRPIGSKSSTSTKDIESMDFQEYKKARTAGRI